MEILLWLVPAVVATSAAMALAAWLGRDRTAGASSVSVPVREPRRGPGEAVSRTRPARVASAEEPVEEPAKEPAKEPVGSAEPVERPRRTA